MLAVPGDEITLDRAIALGARGYLAPDVDRSELAAVAAHSLPTVLRSRRSPGPAERCERTRRTHAPSRTLGRRAHPAGARGAHPA